MKKFIAAFDSLKFSESTKEYALQLAKIANAHLVSIFLSDITHHSYKLSEVLNTHGTLLEKQRNLLDLKDKKIKNSAEEIFEEACQQAGLNYSIHHNRLIAIQELLHESIYSDLLLINSNETLTSYNEGPPTRFIDELLVETHCPVMVVPGKYKPIEKIILLYDGEPSSVYAIKMFSYTMHSLKYLPTEILSVNSPNESLHLHDNKLMKEFMKRHYPKANYTVLKGDATGEILYYLNAQHENPLVVLGAYQRGRISRLIKESMADILMKTLTIPLFIAHN